jgi:hypothetical protein
MARGWKCPRCSTENGEGTMNCSRCGLIRGGVVVPGSYVPPIEAESGTTGSAGSDPAASVWRPQPAPTPTGPDGSPDPIPGGVSGPPVGWVQPNAAPAAGTGGVPIWRRIPAQFIIVGVILLVGAIGGLVFNASRSDTGEIIKSGNLTAKDLRAGDCFDLKDPEAEEVDEVTALPCTDEHEYEMFFVGNMAGSDFPAEDAVTTFLTDNCLPAFTTFVGLAYEDSELDIFWLSPTTESWQLGDHSIQCAVYHPRIHRLTESLQGSAR